MKTATVGSIQKNFAEVLKEINSGEEVVVTRHGEPVAKIIALGPKENLDWPDFFADAVEVTGKDVSELVVEGREDRF